MAKRTKTLKKSREKKSEKIVLLKQRKNKEKNTHRAMDPGLTEERNNDQMH